MRIGIIGAGSIGATLARKLTALGHDVMIANSRGPETLAQLAADSGATPVALRDVAIGTEVVILAVPVGALPTLTGVHLPDTVVDAGNYVPGYRDAPIPALDQGLVESRWTERVLGHPVVKAFNTISAESLRRPRRATEAIAAPVAGDDAATKAVVMTLLDNLGFDAFDAGGLDDSWRQQPGTPVHTADLSLAAARAALGEARPEQTRAWRRRMAGSA
jgi:8-hydroxy-5-deazaflavin:NADPH oxidoreductase